MQKKAITILMVLLVAVIFASPKQGHSFGMGIYVPFGAGNGTITLTDFDYDFDYDASYSGGLGIVLDTKVARDGLFNYRLNVGLINGSVTYEGNTSEQDGYKFYVVDNTFGFGVLRTSWLRLWLGPQIRLAYMDMEDTSGDYTETIYGVGFGFAPVIGANFNFGPVFTAALDFGYRFSSYAGQYEFEEWDSYYGYYYTTSEDYTRSENMFFINFSLIFRMGDNYDNVEDFF